MDIAVRNNLKARMLWNHLRAVLVHRSEGRECPLRLRTLVPAVFVIECSRQRPETGGRSRDRGHYCDPTY